MTDAGEKGVGRRGFLGAIAGLSAAAAATGAAGPAAAQESAEEMTKARYQETEHVLKFYETNRY
jgi:nitrous oxide reductase